jgi:hypothetical protein
MKEDNQRPTSMQKEQKLIPNLTLPYHLQPQQSIDIRIYLDDKLIV